MNYRRILSLFVMVLFTGLVAACASSGGSEERGPTTLRVMNNVQPSGPVTIRMLSASGTSGAGQMIGNVGTGETTTLRVDASMLPGEYILLAVFDDGRQIRSASTVMSPGVSYSWNLSANILSR